MKKVIAAIMSAVLLFGITACGKTEKAEEGNRAAATTKQKNNATYTGFPALNEITFKVTDPENSRGIPNEKIEHAYGIAKGGEPHQISVDSQKFFEEKKLSAVTYDTKTKEKVLYLTFDCGYENGNTEKILDVLKEKNVRAAFFCTLDDIRSSPEIIARMIKEGHIVGNHSATHPSFPEISRTEMAKEIEECENFLRKNFGYTSQYFRFPKGEYSENALELTGSLGYKSIFWSASYADWDTSAQKGADYAFQKITPRLHPGAIILLHAVSSDNAAAMGRIIDFARGEGYEFSTLDKIPLS